MKFCRPIYKAIYKVDADLAVKTFKEHAGFYRESTSRKAVKEC